MKLDEIKRLAEKATPGPWEWKGEIGHSNLDGKGDEFAHVLLYDPYEGHAFFDREDANAAYIAALSPERILAMIRVIEAADNMRDLIGKDSSQRATAKHTYDAARAELEKL